jgi:hypothetical protein
MACANHPEVPEVTQCDQCHRGFCADCFVMLEGRPLCGQCKDQVVRRVERGFALEVGSRGPSPWERERSFASLVETLRSTLLTPSEFFGGLALEGKGYGYWSYLIILGWPSAVLGAVIAFLVPSLAGFMGRGVAPFAAQSAIMLGVVVLLAPLQLLIGTSIQAAIAHLFLRIVGGANARLETTVRAAVYAQSVLIFNWVPILGPLVGGIWGLVLLIIGLKQMHSTSYGRVLAAVLLPVVVCGGFLLFAILLPLMMRRGR